MLDKLIQWSLRNRLLTLSAATLLLLGGGYVASTMPVDVFPDLTAPTVTVLAEAHGMAPEEVETVVTFPIQIQSSRGALGMIGLSVVLGENRPLKALSLDGAPQRLGETCRILGVFLEARMISSLEIGIAGP